MSDGALTFDDMARLHHACFQDDRPWPADEIAQILANPHNFAVHKAGGFLLASAVADQAEIITLAVDPVLRRQGIGRDLVAQFLHIAAEMGAEMVFLEVESGNTAAIALYQACGFAQTGLRRGYYRKSGGAVADGLILSCRVPPLSTKI